MKDLKQKLLDEKMKDLKQKLLDDLWAFGECATKTHIVDGVVRIDYVDPASPEFEEAKSNANGYSYSNGTH